MTQPAPQQLPDLGSWSMGSAASEPSVAILHLEHQAWAALPQLISSPGPQLRQAVAHMAGCSQLGLALVAPQGGQRQERVCMLQVG
jgi:hypothetical protein